MTLCGEARRVAVITGASRGIGHSIAATLRDDGYDVWALSRTAGSDNRVHHVPCDLGDPQSTEVAIEYVLAQVPRIDAVIANSALRNLGEVGDLPLIKWREAVEVNLSSVVMLVQRTLPALRHNRGCIVVIGSHAGSHFFEGGAAYCATKAALKALVEVLLLEERPRGVRTTLLNMGAVANETGDVTPTKLTVSSVAQAVSWVTRAPGDLVVGELEIRPSRLPTKPVCGFDRLQAI